MDGLTPSWPLMALFGALVLGVLILDLAVFHRSNRPVRMREALCWAGIWVALALGFAGFVYIHQGRVAALTFLTTYVVEWSLSVDNLFVFVLVFASFRIPSHLQRRVLFWGIIGAFVMRAICIGAGVAAIQRFHWVNYIFGVILFWGGAKALFARDDDDKDPSQGLLARSLRRVLPLTSTLDGERFFVREGGQRRGTPLLLALLMIEASDLIFAADSIPAALAISTDTFIVYTSNIFAILGLRSIYFALAHLLMMFRYLRYAVAIILLLVGAKIFANGHVVIPVEVMLGLIGALLGGSILLSALIKPVREGTDI